MLITFFLWFDFSEELHMEDGMVMQIPQGIKTRDL